MKGSISVPYKENDINGIFRKIAKITKSKNIFRDGFISFYSSSIDAKTCFDVLVGAEEYTTTYAWFSTQGDDPDPWITIDFHSLKLIIEELVVYSAPVDFRSVKLAIEWIVIKMALTDYFPKYEVLVSNDNSTWEKVGEKTFDSQPKTEMQSFSITKKEARFIKLHGVGQRFGGGDLRMAIYQMDLFGNLTGVSPFRQTCHARRKTLLLNVIFIEIITLS